MSRKQIKTTNWLIKGISKEELEGKKQEAIKEAEAELKQKQIEEMANDLCRSAMCDLETYTRCRMPRGNCGRCQKVAEDLYNAGYRKITNGGANEQAD